MVPFFPKLFLFFPTERRWLSFRSFARCHHNWNLFTVGFTMGCCSNCSLCWSCTELVRWITMHSSWGEGAVSWCKVCQLFSFLVYFSFANWLLNTIIWCLSCTHLTMLLTVCDLFSREQRVTGFFIFVLIGLTVFLAPFLKVCILCY